MAKKKMHNIQAKKDKNHVGTINMNELIINRKGKINSGTSGGLGTRVHKSKLDYDRNTEKKKLRDRLENLDF